jgi:hypothetical protein
LTDWNKSLTLPLVLAASPKWRRTHDGFAPQLKRRTECAVRHGCRLLIVWTARSSVSQDGRVGQEGRGKEFTDIARRMMPPHSFVRFPTIPLIRYVPRRHTTVGPVAHRRDRPGSSQTSDSRQRPPGPGMGPRYSARDRRRSRAWCRQAPRPEEALSGSEVLPGRAAVAARSEVNGPHGRARPDANAGCPRDWAAGFFFGPPWADCVHCTQGLPSLLRRPNRPPEDEEPS